MVQGKINRGRHTDYPAGRHSIRINQCAPPSSPIFFTGRMPFPPPNQQCQSTEGFDTAHHKEVKICYISAQLMNSFSDVLNMNTQTFQHWHDSQLVSILMPSYCRIKSISDKQCHIKGVLGVGCCSTRARSFLWGPQLVEVENFYVLL